MENASKALLMAGGILIALLIIGALLLMFNNLSTYQEVGERETREAQVIEFNNQFETYLRTNLRGNEMLSLMNRVVDYNTRNGDNSQEKFQEMKMTVTGIDVEKLKYDKNDANFIERQYTQNNIDDLIGNVKNIEDKYQMRYITQLVTNITKVMTSQDEAEQILPKSLNSYNGGYDQIKRDTASYYQYSQFKRLHFDCDTSATKYNSNTGRIIEVKFVCTNKLD